MNTPRVGLIYRATPNFLSDPERTKRLTKLVRLDEVVVHDRAFGYGRHAVIYEITCLNDGPENSLAMSGKLWNKCDKRSLTADKYDLVLEKEEPMTCKTNCGFCDRCAAQRYVIRELEARDAEIARLTRERDEARQELYLETCRANVAHEGAMDERKAKEAAEARIAELEAECSKIIVAKEGVFDSTAEEVKSEVYSAISEMRDVLRDGKSPREA